MSKTELIEGRDYILENGLFVFTRDYLARRGYCCKSGCRNCPYGELRPLPLSAAARVVSLVPSWTETLIEAGVSIVGRTRYCVHPADTVRDLPALGGTKKIDLNALRHLNPDLIVMDKEENSAEIAEQVGEKGVVTHVTSIEDMGRELRNLARIFMSGAETLLNLAVRWERVAAANSLELPILSLPGVKQWITKPQSEPESVLYLIWREPLMAAAADTFVGSVLSKLLGEKRIFKSTERYPNVDLRALDPARTVLLFASEPFPFERYVAEIQDLGFPSALVDGELFSWFGVRSLALLEKALENHDF